MLKQAQQWQLISTVPMDGTAVLVYLEAPTMRSRIHIGVFRPNITTIGGYFSFDMPAATHWMALPDPPE